MAFKNRLDELISTLEIENMKVNDPALYRVVEILKSIEKLNDLKSHAGLIKRISIDSIENKNTTEIILGFTDNYAKFK